MCDDLAKLKRRRVKVTYDDGAVFSDINLAAHPDRVTLHLIANGGNGDAVLYRGAIAGGTICGLFIPNGYNQLMYTARDHGSLVTDAFTYHPVAMQGAIAIIEVFEEEA